MYKIRIWRGLVVPWCLFLFACSQPAKKAEKSVGIPMEPIMVKAEPIPPMTLSLSRQEFLAVNKIIQKIKLGKPTHAISELEKILGNDPSPEMKCTALALMSYTVLQIGRKKEFLVFAQDMVKACERFRLLPVGIRVLAKLYSNWSGKPLPESLEAQL